MLNPSRNKPLTEKLETFDELVKCQVDRVDPMLNQLIPGSINCQASKQPANINLNQIKNIQPLSLAEAQLLCNFQIFIH